MHTGNSYRIGDLLLKYTETGVPVFQFYAKKYKTLPYLLFDIEEVVDADTGMVNKILKFKNIDGVNLVLSETGNSIRWMEQRYRPVTLKVAANVTNSTNIQVAPNDGFTINDLAVDDVIIIKTSTQSYKRTITAITGSTITVDSPVTVNQDDLILLTYNVKSEFDTINKKYNPLDFEEFESYYQFFTTMIEFNQSELNKTYEFPVSVEEYVKQKMAINVSRLMEAVAYAIYLGENKSPASGKPETAGIISMIQRYNTNSNQLIHNLTGSTVNERILTLLDILHEAYQSGVYENGVITVVGTTKALSEIAYATGHFHRALQFEAVSKDVNQLNIEVITLSTGRGFKVEFFSDFILDEIAKMMPELGDKFLIVLPREKVALYQRKNKALDASLRLIQNQPTFEMDRITDYVNPLRVSPVETFTLRGHFATLLAGMKSGAYRIIKNINLRS